MFMNEKTWDYVHRHADEDVRKLALQGVKDREVDLTAALQQIAGRQTARRKLPTWAATEGMVYPPHLNMEQCSSEQTARYKARLAGEGEAFADLTGGLGVDFYWMSQGFKERTYVEQNADLCTIAEENFRTLKHDCIVCCCNATTYLTQAPHVSVAFLDPARRNEHGGRTYGIEDCTPNVLELLPLLMEKADKVILKLSPMLDWRKAVSDLNGTPTAVPHHVSEVHIVSVDNECKELLLVVLNRETTDNVHLYCVNNDETFDFIPLLGTKNSLTGNKTFPYWESTESREAAICLYEPNASLMKAGCFDVLAERFPVRQVALNSHLYLASKEINGFPGRGFRVECVSSMNKQELKAALADIGQANIAVRNFPLSADQLRKKMKIKDGGSIYIFATTTSKGEHKLFICRKIS